MSERSIGWSASLWLLICAGLAGVIALELSSSLPLAPEVTAAAPAVLPEAAAKTARFEPPPPDAFDEIALRPLFFESRRPFEPPAPDAGPAAEPVVEEKLAIELVGTLVTDQRRAALLQPDGQSASWRREGERIGGWQVGAIEQERVTLRSGEATETLELRDDLAGPEKRKAETRRERKRNRQQQQQAGEDDSEGS